MQSSICFNTFTTVLPYNLTSTFIINLDDENLLSNNTDYSHNFQFIQLLYNDLTITLAKYTTAIFVWIFIT